MAYTYTFIVRSGRDNIDINNLKIGPNFFNNCDYKIIQTDQISYCLSMLSNKDISGYDFDKCRIITISTDMKKGIFVWCWKNTNLIISVNIQRITKFTNDQKNRNTKPSTRYSRQTPCIFQSRERFYQKIQNKSRLPIYDRSSI